MEMSCFQPLEPCVQTSGPPRRRCHRNQLKGGRTSGRGRTGRGEGVRHVVRGDGRHISLIALRLRSGPRRCRLVGGTAGARGVLGAVAIRRRPAAAEVLLIRAGPWSGGDSAAAFGGSTSLLEKICRQSPGMEKTAAGFCTGEKLPSGFSTPVLPRATIFLRGEVSPLVRRASRRSRTSNTVPTAAAV